MAKHNYKVLSEEGQAFAASQGLAVELEDEAELDLTVDQKRALVAAGWLEEVPEKKEVKK